MRQQRRGLLCQVCLLPPAQVSATLQLGRVRCHASFGYRCVGAAALTASLSRAPVPEHGAQEVGTPGSQALSSCRAAPTLVVKPTIPPNTHVILVLHQLALDNSAPGPNPARSRTPPPMAGRTATRWRCASCWPPWSSTRRDTSGTSCPSSPSPSTSTSASLCGCTPRVRRRGQGEGWVGWAGGWVVRIQGRQINRPAGRSPCRQPPCSAPAVVTQHPSRPPSPPRACSPGGEEHSHEAGLRVAVHRLRLLLLAARGAQASQGRRLRQVHARQGGVVGYCWRWRGGRECGAQSMHGGVQL